LAPNKDMTMKQWMVVLGLTMGAGLMACAAPTSASSESAAEVAAPSLLGVWTEGSSFEGSTLSFEDDGTFTRQTVFTALGFPAPGHDLPHGTVHEDGTFAFDGEILTLRVLHSDGASAEGATSHFAVTFGPVNAFGPSQITLQEQPARGSHIVFPAITYDRVEPALGVPVDTTVIRHPPFVGESHTLGFPGFGVQVDAGAVHTLGFPGFGVKADAGASTGEIEPEGFPGFGVRADAGASTGEIEPQGFPGFGVEVDAGAAAQ
jgi:hypothetical protein